MLRQHHGHIKLRFIDIMLLETEQWTAHVRLKLACYKTKETAEAPGGIVG